jgi:hypothetical protein
MAAERSSGIPLAIVTGSAIIGVCLYLGLLAGAPPPAGVAPPVASAPTLVPPTKAPAPTVDPHHIQRQAQAALDAHKPGLSQRCWTPPAAGEPEAITLDYDITFGPEGGIVMLGIGERREAHRTSVADCVRRQPRPTLRIDPPGENMRVPLTLRLP